MVSSNKASFKPGLQSVMQVLTVMTIALLGLGLVVTIWYNITVARQLEKDIRGIIAQQQVVQSGEKLSEAAQRQTSEELAKAEASLDKMNNELIGLVSKLQQEIDDQRTDRNNFLNEIAKFHREREKYDSLLNNLSTELKKLSESSNMNRFSEQKAGGTQ
ncbi:MAG TPA: hypothetical protein DDZ51_22775 [Planctomycetaceae bacterium]|nr:hypothetical protein [Planctomycetaceae bacterium]